MTSQITITISLTQWVIFNKLILSKLQRCSVHNYLNQRKDANPPISPNWSINGSSADACLLPLRELCAWLKRMVSMVSREGVCVFSVILGVRTDWERTSHHTVTAEGRQGRQHTPPWPALIPALPLSHMHAHTNSHHHTHVNTYRHTHGVILTPPSKNTG